MPEEARVQCSIWSDPAVLALPSGWPKFLYVFLFTQPEISMCGRLVLAESYWASTFAPEATPELIRGWLGVLADHRFVAVDYEASELLVRARIRRDKVLASPKLIKPLIRACQAIRSGQLRAVVAAELRRCQLEGLVPSRLSDDVDELASSMERTSGFSIAPLFSADPVSPQANTLSAKAGYPIRDFADSPRGKGEGGRVRSRGGPGGELALIPDTRPARLPAAKIGTDGDPDWCEFWAAYPKKVSKGDARRAWVKAIQAGTDPAVIVKGAAMYAQARAQEDPQYTVFPATWLNRERWTDDPAALTGPARLSKNDQAVVEGLARSEMYRQEEREQGQR